MTRKKTPALIYFLAFVSALFIGILVFAYVVAKRTNPVMLDDHGRQQPTAALILPSA
ncbi:MAG: hypothetical protein U0Q18_32235 [Bryobacteraceae bacterium]